MKIGVSLADPPATLSLEIARAAEELGLDQVWAFDSHVLWHDCYTLLAWLVAAVPSERLEYGVCVTNPVTRDPTVTASACATLNELTGGRMICGIGRGDSAVRLMKRRPSNLSELEASVGTIRELAAGRAAEVDGVRLELPWARGRLPVYVAAYGPRALRLAGRVADGVIFQTADPYFIEWGLGFVREGAREAGRDPAEIVVHCATATAISSDRSWARDATRWFPAVVGNHIADVLRHHDAAELPPALFDYVHGREGYDYREHGVPGAEHSQYVPDEIVDRFCVLGTEEECEAKLRELAALGVSELNIYPHSPELPSVIEAYGRRIGPRLK